MSYTHLDYPRAKLLIQSDTEPEQVYRAHACAKEPWTVDFIEGIPPEGLLWDVGANVGSYTLIALACKLRVVAIEPGYANYARLCHNLALNDFLGLPLLLCGMAGPKSGFEWLHYGDLRPGGANHGVGGETARGYHRQQVPMFKLDDLVIGMNMPGPHYLKIDTDGGEIGVLEGAKAMLQMPDARGMVLEMQRDQEATITSLLAAEGWSLTSRHAPRQEVCYGIFQHDG